MFTATEFLTLAKARYGEAILRGRMRGAIVPGDQNATNAAADTELEKIASGVISRVQAAATAQGGWPFPTPYDDTWPDNLLQNALDLFNWRTVSGLEGTADNFRTVGKMAESYFDQVQQGGISLGIGTPGDKATPEFVNARNRDGSSNISGICDTENALDAFRGLGWDRFR